MIDFWEIGILFVGLLRGPGNNFVRVSSLLCTTFSVVTFFSRRSAHLSGPPSGPLRGSNFYTFSHITWFYTQTETNYTICGKIVESWEVGILCVVLLRWPDNNFVWVSSLVCTTFSVVTFFSHRSAHPSGPPLRPLRGSCFYTFSNITWFLHTTWRYCTIYGKMIDFWEMGILFVVLLKWPDNNFVWVSSLVCTTFSVVPFFSRRSAHPSGPPLGPLRGSNFYTFSHITWFWRINWDKLHNMWQNNWILRNWNIVCSSAEMTRQQFLFESHVWCTQHSRWWHFFHVGLPILRGPLWGPFGGAISTHSLISHDFDTQTETNYTIYVKNGQFLRNWNLICGSAERTRKQFCLSLMFGVHNILGGDIFFTSVCLSFGAPFGVPSGERFQHILSFYIILTHKLRQIT